MKSKKAPDPHIQEVIAELKIGKEDTLKRYYPLYRDPFVYSMRKYGKDDHAAKVAYQDAMVRFYEKALFPAGKKEKPDNLDNYDCSFKTCIYAIAVRFFWKRHRTGRLRIVYSEDVNEQKEFERIVSDLIDEEEEKQVQVDQMLEAVQELGMACKKMLYLFYFENLNISEITKIYAYASNEVVRATKARCLANLRRLL